MQQCQLYFVLLNSRFLSTKYRYYIHEGHQNGQITEIGKCFVEGEEQGAHRDIDAKQEYAEPLVQALVLCMLRANNVPHSSEHLSIVLVAVECLENIFAQISYLFSFKLNDCFHLPVLC